MHRTLPIAGALALGLMVGARADHKDGHFAQGSQVVVVGQITSPPKGAINEKKMQVAVGPARTDYTLHFRDAHIVGLQGQKLDEDGLDDKMWVRAEGKMMKDARRVEVSRIQVISKDQPGFKRSAFHRWGLDQGYISTVAGAREVFPAPAAPVPAGLASFVMVGRVTSDTGPFESTRKLQVQTAGNEWTLHVPKEASVLDLKGEKVSVHEIKKGQWVRAYGWRTDDLRVRVDRLENVGAQAAYEASPLFRRDFPLGYIDPLEGADAFAPLSVTGTIVDLGKDTGTVMIRDAEGRTHVVYTDNARIRRGTDSVTITDLKNGDTVTVEGRTIRFR